MGQDLQPQTMTSKIRFTNVGDFLHKTFVRQRQIWKRLDTGTYILIQIHFAIILISRKVAMRIFTHNEEAYGWNVIGTIRGQLEPGRLLDK